MVGQTIKGRHADAVVQFSVFTANRLGQLSSLISLLASKDIHMLALTVLDSTDSAIIRFVSDDPEGTRDLLNTNSIPFSECQVLVVEMKAVSELSRLVVALLRAELNINYLYSFIPHPDGKYLLALNMEDNEMGEASLKAEQFRTLKQSDITR